MTRLLVFDSGIGGLSVVREIRRTVTSTEILYVADDVGFPYGDWQAVALTEHVVAAISHLVGEVAPDAVVIACNTASTLVLPPLRSRFAVPFVGTVPAVKPAAEQTRSGLFSVLATLGTIRRDYTRDLIERFARSSDVCLVGSDKLAPLAEAFMRGEPIDDEAVRSEIAPAFVERDGRRTDAVVLACTHYPFLAERFRGLAPWPVAWIDPGPAIARRVAQVVAARGTGAGGNSGHAKLTSGRVWPEALKPFLRELCLEPE